MFTCAAVTLAVPAAFNCTVTSCATAVGAILSCTVTTAVAVLLLPFTSVTVKVTVFAPTFAHVKLFGDTVMVAIEQLSDEPLFTCAAVTLAVPAAFN